MSCNLVRGNALHIPLADGCVQTCVTSPPYWGLRDYGVAGQIGLEATPAQFVAELVTVFREVWRVLRDDGTCWLNLGDSYAGNSSSNGEGETRNLKTEKFHGGTAHLAQRRVTGNHGLKTKDLCGIPWRVAFALQADGWYLRSDIIWHKPNPMPESVTDRPTKAHEYLFLLAKQEQYFYDAMAIREEGKLWDGQAGTFERENGKATELHAPGQAHASHRPNRKNGGGGFSRAYAEQQPAHGAMTLDRPPETGYRNRRTVWTIPTAPYSGAHFATFPPALVEPCILAGTSARGCCSVCGAPWERVTERDLTYTPVPPGSAKATDRQNGNGYYRPNSKETGGVAGLSHQVTTGWTATCAHADAPTVPATVLDPFSGSGTVGKVCIQHRRNYVGLDLNPDYIDLALGRTDQVQIQMGIG